MSDRDYTQLLGADFDIELVVDLIKRSDKADAIELLRGVIACARSGGAVEASSDAWGGAFAAFDRAAAALSSTEGNPSAAETSMPARQCGG